MAAAAASSLEVQAVGHSAPSVLAGYGTAVRGGGSVRARLRIVEAAIEELAAAAAACETGGEHMQQQRLGVVGAEAEAP